MNVPRRIISTAWEVLTAPSSFARAGIDGSPASTRRALAFYLNIFGVVFLASTVTSHFYYYSGTSEARDLVRLTIQIGLAVPVLFFLNRLQAAHRRPTMQGILQGVLYADALFLIVFAAFAAGLGFFTYPGAIEDIDIISTEWEKCVVSKSFVYWLLRGELEFLSQPEQTELVQSIRSYGRHSQFLVIIPFAHLFARMMKARFGANYWLNLHGGIATFALVVLSWNYVTDQYEKYLAQKSQCRVESMRNAMSKYNKDRLTQQVLNRINVEFSNTVDQPGAHMRVNGNIIEMKALEYPFTGEAFRLTALKFLSVMIEWYCNNETELSKARYLELGLRLTMISSDGKGLQPVIEDKHCYDRPGLSLGKNLGRHLDLGDTEATSSGNR